VAAQTRNLNLSYYPWITQNLPAETIRRAVNEFATVLASKASNDTIAYTVTVQKPLDVPTQIEWIAKGQSDIALMNPLGYVFARGRNPKVQANVLAKRIIDGAEGTTYFAQIYAAKKTAIANGDAPPNETEEDRTRRLLPQARGKRLGIGSAQSTSNFLIPALMLQQAGVHPFASFSTVQFVGGHELVARAVYDGAIDLGAGHDGVIHDLASQYGYGDAAERLIRIGRSKPIPSDPVAINLEDENLRRHINAALIQAGADDAGKASIATFWGKATGLAGTVPEAFDGLHDALSTLGLREADLIRAT
jgi:ABC-type phosphate/phosphonate transport system substrate-binding protein